MVKKVVIQAIKLHNNNKPKPPPQATAKKQAPLRTPLLLTAPQRILIKPMKTTPTPL